MFNNRNRTVTCSSLNINVFLSFTKKICFKEDVRGREAMTGNTSAVRRLLKEDEVSGKFFSNKIIVTLVTKGLPSSLLSWPVA